MTDTHLSAEVFQEDILSLCTRLKAEGRSVDLALMSPPYEDQRLYGDLKFKVKGEAWVKWALERYLACLEVTTGLVCWVVEGKTKNFAYSGSPILLMADLIRAGVKGVTVRKPPIYARYSIPGSGGPDWWRNDYEFMICASHGKLPWSDNTATGHVPKWAAGGEMSYRMTDGTRRNQWGGSDKGTNSRRVSGERQNPGRPSHVIGTKSETVDQDPEDTRLFGNLQSTGGKRPDGTAKKPYFNGKGHPGSTKRLGRGNPDGSIGAPGWANKGRTGPIQAAANGTVKGAHDRDICVLANPGNITQQRLTYEEWMQLTGTDLGSDIRRCNVGGGMMGSDIAHENEAPYPESLCDGVIRSFCRPGGTVLDGFSGSGTTAAAALKAGRNFIGCDVRADQCELTRRRIREAVGDLNFDRVLRTFSLKTEGTT